jgi:hypothetical protein
MCSSLGAETAEAAPVAQEAAQAVQPVAPAPVADSLIGDLLMDMGPTQPVAAPVAPVPAGMINMIQSAHNTTGMMNVFTSSLLS